MKPEVNIDITRREFHRLCALGSSLPIVSAMTGSLCTSALAATKASSKNTRRTVKFRDGTIVPALGQGSAGLAEDKRPAAAEEEALRTGELARMVSRQQQRDVRFSKQIALQGAQ